MFPVEMMLPDQKGSHLSMGAVGDKELSDGGVAEFTCQVSW